MGDLLCRGLVRLGVESLVYGPVNDSDHGASHIASFGPQCLVGIPTQVLAIASSFHAGGIEKGSIESVLLSTDYVPRAIARTLERVWGCRVFTHYGMTETGLGGGVECEALAGYHLREADLYFEVIDRETGEPCPDGAFGEVVFTTLTRRAMPLIRYRTGDIARIIPEPCPCGSLLRRMERVRGRWEGVIRLAPGSVLTLADIDEALFSLPGLLDYRASISKGADHRLLLNIEVHGAKEGQPAESGVFRALGEVEAIKKAMTRGVLERPVVRFSSEGQWSTTGVAKRRIITPPIL